MNFPFWYTNLARRWSALLRHRRGAGLFFYPIKWADRLLGADRAWIEFSNGLFVPLNWSDMIVHHLIRDGRWETRETKLVQAIAPKCRVFLDVGANVGYFSMVAAKTMPPGGKVFAFEPNPELVDLAQGSFDRSSLTSIQLVPAAVGNRNCKVRLHINRGANRGKTSLYEANTNRGRTVEVNCVRLDDFFASSGLTSLDFVKIDVEGHEWFAVKGALETLCRYKPVMLLELAPTLLAQAGKTAEDVLDLLRPLGYRVSRQWHPDNYVLSAEGTPSSEWIDSLVAFAESS